MIRINQIKVSVVSDEGVLKEKISKLIKTKNFNIKIL